MNVKRIELGELGANCYLLSSEKAAIVIDAGEYSPEAARFLKENSDKERLILLTHGHFDHIGGADRLRSETDTPIAIGEGDAVALSDSHLNLSAYFGIPTKPFYADKIVTDGEAITVGDITLRAIECKGHTKGGMCYLTEDVLFSGDILFCGSVGRTDFPNGSTTELMNSIKKILTLEGKTRVLSGHGCETTIEHERLYNPFLRGKI